MFPRKIGRYQVSGELGRGGMAVVYLARDPFVKRQVAIKMLPVQFTGDDAFRARFRREAEIIAALEHKHIVPVYDVGEHADQPYIVMPHMAGGSLFGRLKRLALALDEAARLLTAIGSALDHAHGKGVVHRDLKPSNILFDQQGEPYVSDFGLAKLLSASRLTTAGLQLGTPAYMSPEQWRSDPNLDGRTDVYALGCMAFEMLSGRLPFEADMPLQFMHQHLEKPPPDISQLVPGLPRQCGPIVAHALVKDAKRRYQSAGEFVRAFSQMAGGRPTAQNGVSQPTHPPGPLGREPASNLVETPHARPGPTRPTKPGRTWTNAIRPWGVAVLGVATLLIAVAIAAAVGVWAGSQAIGARPLPQLGTAQAEELGNTATIAPSLQAIWPPSPSPRVIRPSATHVPATSEDVRIVAPSLVVPTPPPVPPTEACGDVFGPFAGVWAQIRAAFGCPHGPAIEGLVVEENFDGGKMLWREPIDIGQALVVFNNGGWRIYQHAPFVEGSPEFPCADADTPAQSPPTPRRGFGTMWCDIPEIRDRLGNATDAERAYTGSMQQFDRGFMVRTDYGAIFVFYANGNWERR